MKKKRSNVYWAVKVENINKPHEDFRIICFQTEQIARQFAREGYDPKEVNSVKQVKVTDL